MRKDTVYYVKVKGEQGSRLMTKDLKRAQKYAQNLEGAEILTAYTGFVKEPKKPTFKNLKDLFRL